MTGVDAVFVRMLSRPVPRVSRMMEAARQRGFQPLYVAARREAGLPERDNWDGYDVLRVGPTLPMLNGRGLGRYLYGILVFNWAVLRLLFRTRPRLVHCSDIEGLPAGLLYCKLTRTRLMYNIHDNFADRYAIPLVYRRVLNVVEGLCVLTSDVALVPEEYRKDALPRWSRKKITVVRNSVTDVDARPPVSGFGERPVRISYCGWLDPGRGLFELLRLAEDPAFEVVIAGDGSEELKQAVAESRATYLGFLTHEDSLEEMARSDFVAVMYAPVRPINRSAAPNKLAESLALGRPVIGNSEMIILQQEAVAGCAIRFPYEAISDVAPALHEVFAQGEPAFARMCVAARAAYEEMYAPASIRASIDAAFSGT